jgi:hypothetical protein
MTIRTSFLPLLAGTMVAAISAMGGCGANNNQAGYGSSDDDASMAASDDSGGGGGGSSSGSSSSDSGGFIIKLGDSSAATACTGTGQLDCYVPKGCTTELTGTVYDPAGRNPIYNAIVFIPDSTTGALTPITTGTAGGCNTCDASIGNYLTAALTNYKGEFTLTGVPATTHVPLVVQIGKWRREVFLPEVKACTNNVVAAADSRLPAKKSEGDMPQMALLTGGADQLGCFLAGLGIDASEWTGPKGGGRLDVYSGVGGAGLSTTGTAGACSGAGCPLWSTMPNLEYYDMALLACEGGTNDQTKAAPAMQNMHDWLDEGGKVFATHYHYTWFKDGPANGCANCTDFVNTATWLGSSSGSQDNTFAIDTSFTKGAILQEWLANLGLATGNNIALTGVASSVGLVNPTAQRWIYDNSGGATNNQTKYMTILTPVGGVPPTPAAADAGKDAAPESSGPQYCGKAVFSDLHAGSSGGIISFGGGGSVPGTCNTSASLTAQEAALEFLFFDLSACVSVETAKPMIPPSMPPQ